MISILLSAKYRRALGTALLASTRIVAPINAQETQDLRREDLPRAVGYLRCDTYPQDGNLPWSLGVESASFENLTVADSSATYQRLLADWSKSRRSTTTAELFFFEDDTSEWRRQRRLFRLLEETGTNRVYSVWNDTGFETIKNVIAVWRTDGTRLRLETILDKVILAGIGYAFLSEASPLPNGAHLLIGQTSGGDGGDVWGSLWVATWHPPRHLQFLYQNRFSGDEANGVELDYRFNRKSLNLEVIKKTRRLSMDSQTGKSEYTPWESAAHTVDLKALLAHGDSPFIAPTSDGHMVVLPEKMERALKASVPGFRPWSDSELLPDIIKGYVFTNKQSPSAVVGEFNGDGIPDAFLIGRAGYDYVGVGLLSQGAEYRAITVHRHTLMANMYERYTIDGRSSSAWPGYLRLFSARKATSPWMDKPLELKTDGFIWAYYGKASALYYYSDGKFAQYTLSD